MAFKDHFSGHAGLYARYRPDYPPALFEYLATLTPHRECALDCATGSGQAARALARHFDLVIASDGSLQQLQHAASQPQVVYMANLAEQPALRDGCLDLVVVAQAVHWFDHERFYLEMRRVLRPEGVLAVWTYGLARVDPDIDRIVEDFYSQVVGEYWPPERRYIENAYRTLPFPLRELTAPAFELELQWNLDTFVGYLATWSAVQRYVKAVGHDPLPALREQIVPHWNSSAVRRSVLWPLHLRVGRL